MKKHAELEGRTAVVLANTGTPGKPTPQAVRKYLSQFLMDRRIRPMGLVPWSLILHLCILPKRGKASAQKYRSIWTPEGSPLVATQEKLARGLEAHFAAQGTPVTVRSAMSYGQPSLEAAIKQLKKAGAARIVVLPLYPQAAFSTTGSVTDKAERAFRKSHFKGETVVVSDYHNHPVYLKAMAAAIRNAGYNPASDDRLLFSFHSVPLNDLEAGDNYELQVGASSLGIANELGLDRRQWTIGYQCQFDKGRQWLKPFSRDTLKAWAENAGDARVFIACPNFAIDCLETIYDIQQQFVPEYTARKRDWELYGEAHDHDGEQPAYAPAATGEIVYVPCLNATKAHVKVLASVLEPHLGLGR
ncbi:ferrochelatase [Parvibacter caecicola]|uniref:Coproporphyrin III ferrochelatase n=1 Tax=Parvibacter caecicola TaxID=747645 RepID=A0A4T9TFQ6_9ACTN|nr:ferrochelatase [Parvibacter caecicola]TJW12168.1 ferrochelatase [Parvibacter caecicola]